MKSISMTSISNLIDFTSYTTGTKLETIITRLESKTREEVPVISNNKNETTETKLKTTLPRLENSQKWLTGPRLSNTNVMTDDLALSLIMDASPPNSLDGSKHLLLHQSICPENSNFLNSRFSLPIV